MAFQMKSKVLRGPQEVLCDLHVHLPGLPLPLPVSQNITCSALLPLSPPTLCCLGPEHSLHPVWPTVLPVLLPWLRPWGGVCSPWTGWPPWSLPAEPHSSPVTPNCHAPLSLFPLSTETALVPFPALSSAPGAAPDTQCAVSTSLVGQASYLLVEVFQENQAGGRADDGGQAPNGSSIRYAQREALADHLVMLGLVPSVELLIPGAGEQDEWLFL